MGKMKNILVDVVEFENEIKDLLGLLKIKKPAIFDLLFEKDITLDAAKQELYRLVDDEEIVEVTVSAIETGLITKESLKS